MSAKAKAVDNAANNDVDLDLRTGAQTAGSTTVADTVVATIAGIAAREVPGVYKLGHGVLSAAMDRLRGAHQQAVGVRVEVGKREVAVDLELIVEYGIDIHEMATEVRRIIAERINDMTHLAVKEVNVTVVDIHLETAEEPPPKARVE